MTTFFLIRHASCAGLGQTLWGRTPRICLNDEGKLQARQLAETCKGIRFDAVYSSPLERALETADAIAYGMDLEVRKSGALNEIDFGEWSGETFEELARDERWRHFNSRRSTASVPGGESFLEVQNRVVNEIVRLGQEHGDGRVALVSHADVIRAAVAYFAGMPIDLIERFEISPGSVSVIQLDKENVKLLAVNNRGFPVE
jgi:probable phosphoglycerate mutase